MKQGDRDYILKKFFLVAWGMLTLVLLFCVFFLVREMMREGHDPLAALQQKPDTAPMAQPFPVLRPASLGAQEIELYFGAAQEVVLGLEKQTIEFSDSTVENCRHALEHLIRGPRDSLLIPILPESTRIRALYLLGEGQDSGELVVDFSRELISEHLHFKSAGLEALMFYGIVNTLSQAGLRGANDRAVRQVRILIEGAAPQEAFPAHLDLSTPLSADASWLNTRLSRAGGRRVLFSPDTLHA